MSSNLDLRTKIISSVSDDGLRLSNYVTTQWEVGTVYAVNVRVRPTINKYKSHTFKCITGGTSHATTEPVWPTTGGATVTDGTAVWMEDSDDYDRHILGALDIFSKDCPYVVLSSITGDGSSLYAVPVEWVNEFSNILSIEYPINSIPPNYLYNYNYDIINTATGIWKILLKDFAPSASEFFKVRFTVQRDATNIPSGYIEAFCWLATALACTELATTYVNSVDNSISADVVDSFKFAEGYSDRASVYMNMYKNYMGIGDTVSSPAFTISSQEAKVYPYGISRLTHSNEERFLR